MGNASSASPDGAMLATMDQQVDKLFAKLQEMGGMEPQDVLARCGPEAAGLVQGEVAIYVALSDMIERHRSRVPDDKSYFEMRETGVKQLLDLKRMYRDALVQFMVAAETGLTMFPLIANNLTDTVEMIDTHVQKMEATLNLLRDTVREGTKLTASENQGLRQNIQQKLKVLTVANADIKERMMAASNDLNSTIKDISAATPPAAQQK